MNFYHMKFFADLKQKVLEKSYKVYEFALRDAANGRIYHFYLENPASDLQVETSWDKEREKALNVSFMLNDNGARGSAVFRVSVKKSKSAIEAFLYFSAIIFISTFKSVIAVYGLVFALI